MCQFALTKCYCVNKKYVVKVHKGKNGAKYSRMDQVKFVEDSL